MEISYYRKLKEVNRLSRVTCLRSYNVLEHSYMVAMLFKHFAATEDVPYNMVVFEHILHHDIVEAISSDLPYDVKNFNEVTKHSWDVIEMEIVKQHHQLRRYTDDNIKDAMNEMQYKLFKVCDLLDLWIFLKEEQGLGNNTQKVNSIIDKCEELIKGQFVSVDKYMLNYDA